MSLNINYLFFLGVGVIVLIVNLFLWFRLKRFGILECFFVLGLFAVVWISKVSIVVEFEGFVFLGNGRFGGGSLGRDR